MSPRSILLIDDDRALLSALTELLEGCGHRVTAAADGTEAVRAIESGAYDIAITDVLFPGEHRIEAVMDMLRRRGVTRIVAMSGGGQHLPDYYLRLLKGFGAQAVLPKPFTKQQLLAAIDGLSGGDPPSAGA